MRFKTSPLVIVNCLLLQMESILRHCYVMNPRDFSHASNEGDDVFLCEYEYDINWHSFKRLAECDNSDMVRSRFST